MAMCIDPAFIAASLATLPALSPWRTIQIRLGHRCDIRHLQQYAAPTLPFDEEFGATEISM